MIKRILIAAMLVVFVTNCGQTDIHTQQSPQQSSFPPVQLRDTEVRHITSEFVDQTYEIDIAFPREYSSDSSTTYPVIYVLDAEYNFGTVAYIARRLMKEGDIPPVLVVGVAYDTTYDDFYELRARDLTPVNSQWGTGGSERFRQFMAEELIPFINDNYRTKPRDRMLVGHSFGGLFGGTTLLTDPLLFTRYLIVSPSFWYADGHIFDMSHHPSLANGMAAPKVYLSVGADESRRMISVLRKMEDLLRASDYPGLVLKTDILAGEHHRSVFPSAYTLGLRWLYATD